MYSGVPRTNVSSQIVFACEFTASHVYTKKTSWCTTGVVKVGGTLDIAKKNVLLVPVAASWQIYINVVTVFLFDKCPGGASLFGQSALRMFLVFSDTNFIARWPIVGQMRVREIGVMSEAKPQHASLLIRCRLVASWGAA